MGVDCENYGIMGDAGSTGTRLYAMYDIATDSPKAFVIGKQKGGLAKIGAEEAFKEGLGDLLTKAYEHLKSVGCSVEATQKPAKLAILGTAGTRLLAPLDRAKMWNDLKTRINAHINQNNLQIEVLGLQTITGDMEGFSAFLSVNFLKKSVNHNMLMQTDLSGVIDLGGASTQVGIPNKSSEKGTTMRMDHNFIRSFLGFGLKEFSNHLSDKDKSTCAAPASAETDRSEKCRGALKRQFDGYLVEGTSRDAKGGVTSIGKQDIETIRKASVLTVYGISGFHYVTRFMTWLGVLHDNNGNIIPMDKLSTTPIRVADLRAAADLVCSTTLDTLQKKFRSHPEEEKHLIDHTAEEQLGERCYDASYIVMLLEQIYQWTAVTFYFAQDIEGNSVDWPLGAYVIVSSDKNFLKNSQEAVTKSESTSSGTSGMSMNDVVGPHRNASSITYWLSNFVAATVVLALLWYLYRRFRLSREKPDGMELRRLGAATNDDKNRNPNSRFGSKHPDSVPIMKVGTDFGNGSDDGSYPSDEAMKV